MKQRRDFVTNSSSSSFICVAKIEKVDELYEYMKEEFGKFGVRLLEENLTSGFKVKDSDYEWDEFKEFCEENDIEIEDNAMYLSASFIEWSTEGDTEGEDAFLYKNIPNSYKEELLYGGC